VPFSDARTQTVGFYWAFHPRAWWCRTRPEVSVTIVTIPAAAADGSHFLQLYRTSSSVDQNTDPGDECYLVYEAALSSGGAITSVSITDTTPDGLGGASLYTNPSQETILGGNELPPLAYDLAEFGGSMWYADVTFPARATLNLLGVSGTNGLAVNDTITVNGQVFTAKAAENIASKEFLLSTGLATADLNMRATTDSLIRCINRTSAAGAYAIDISEPAPSGIPGAISIQRTDRTSTLTIAVSRSTAWSPAAGITVVPVRHKNGLVPSKPGQPDAVSTSLALSPMLAGSALESIKRIIPTRNSLWVLKSDGIWRVTGSAGQFDVQPFDPTTAILAPKAAVALDNQAYFLADSGVVRVSESGVEIISRPIEETVRKVSMFWQYANATARETDHKFILWGYYVNATHSDLDYSAGLVFDTLTEAWTTRSDYSVNDALVYSDTNQLVRINSSGQTRRERRQPAYSNSIVYGDESAVFTLVGSPVDNGDGTITVQHTGLPTIPGSIFSNGSMMAQYSAGTTVTATIDSFVDSTHMKLRWATGTFVAGDATYYGAIGHSVTFALKSPTPGVMVEWIEGALLFANREPGLATLTTTGASGSDATISLNETQQNGAGIQIRFWPGRVSSYSPYLKVLYGAGSAFDVEPTALAGLSLTFSPQGDGVSR
jgi:hypothetical protein